MALQVMMFDAEIYYDPGLLVYLAGAFHFIGLIITRQVILRLLLLTGSGLYVLYYATVAETPLWDAIYISFMIISANLVGLISLFFRQSRFAIPREHADIYPLFPPLPPGDFRALMKLARRYRVDGEERQITTKDAIGHKLYFVVSGSTRLRKGDAEFILPPLHFLGEIAFLIGVPSSASAWVHPGAEVVEWDFGDLKRKCRRNSRFQLALEAAISVDLARKVARAVGANSVRFPLGAPSEPWNKAG